ncbi:MAG TPA: SLBB domain-containing protein [Longimicrobiales bacterium]|nr:SLBB domain-containing protein [Longimicrobiales bacterium]
MRNSRFHYAHVMLAALLLVAGGARAAQAQDPAQQAAQQQVGRPVGQSEILERLRTSGLTREQAREQLARAGQSVNLLDSYFDILEGGRAGGVPGSLPAPGSDFLAALRGLGIAFDAADGEPTPEEEEALELEADPRIGLPEDDSLRVFGRRLFATATTQFDPVSYGPVDASYRLGPGDNLTLVLTGDVELAYNLEVTREGAIIIPQVGQIFVNGLSLGGLREVLYDRLGRVYSGVRRGADSATRFDVTLGRLRSNHVYLIGEVSTPGQFQVSSVATVFNALYQAKGPGQNGSFRNIEVRRGGRPVQTVDLYRYLINGESSQDIRLEQGDIIFVPMAGRQVVITGNVRRPGIFELKDGESLADAMTFAGGFASNASVSRIQIDRILPPEQRSPGMDRVVIDVPLADAGSGRVQMFDGDSVTVFGISETRRNQITIRGEVGRPGTYAYRDGMSLWDAVMSAEGLLPDAYRPTAHVIRLNPVDGRYNLQQVALSLDENGVPVADLPLQDFDEVVIYGQAAMLEQQTVMVDGRVNSPGTFPFAAGMTVKDLILAAGGTPPDLFAERAHVSRLRPDGTRELLRFELNPDAMGVPQVEVALAPSDQVRLFSRNAMLYGANVSIHGLVREPGSYEWEQGITLQDVVLRAGGFQKGAQQFEVEVARRTSPFERSDTLHTVYRVALASADDGKGGGSVNPNLSMGRVLDVVASGDWRPNPNEFTLVDGDRVFVRRLIGWEDLGVVSISGEVLYPGDYPLPTRTTRVSDVVKATGGLTSEAYVPGFRMVRDSVVVAVDLQRALRRPGSDDDLVLRQGDRLEVPQYEPTVLVTGAVPFESRVRYRAGQGLDFYIRQAGGYTDYSAEDRVSVTYVNGERSVVRKRLLFSSAPNIEPGAVIFVPAAPANADDGIDWDSVLSKVLAAASTIATVLIAADRINR